MKEIEDLHLPFKAWLKENRVPYIYARPDRASGINLGHPDFTILWMGGNISIEFKTPTGKLSDKQIERIKYLQASGNRVEVCRSLEEAIAAIPWAGVALPPGVGQRKHNGSYAKQFQHMRAVVEATVARVEGQPKVAIETEEAYVVMKFGGKDRVYARGAGGGYRKVRDATPADLINFQRMPGTDA